VYYRQVYEPIHAPIVSKAYTNKVYLGPLNNSQADWCRNIFCTVKPSLFISVLSQSAALTLPPIMCTYTRAVFACHHEKWGSRTRECPASERLKRESLPFACQVRDTHERLSTKVPRSCGRCQATDRALRAVREKLAECHRLFEDKFRGYCTAHAASDNLRDERGEAARWSPCARAKGISTEEDEDEVWLREEDDSDGDKADNQDGSINEDLRDKEASRIDIMPCSDERQDKGVELSDKSRSSTAALNQYPYRGANPENTSLIEGISLSDNENLVKSPQPVRETSPVQSTYDGQPDTPHSDGIIVDKEVPDGGVERHPETLHVVGQLLAKLHSYNAKNDYTYVAEETELTPVLEEALENSAQRDSPLHSRSCRCHQAHIRGKVASGRKIGTQW
jgi:hypothetical protein